MLTFKFLYLLVIAAFSSSVPAAVSAASYASERALLRSACDILSFASPPISIVTLSPAIVALTPSVVAFATALNLILTPAAPASAV